MGIIYRITTPTGREYVGKTWNLKRRISDYKYKLNNRHSIIIGSIKKYGWAAHKLDILEDNVPEEILDEREMFWISELKTYHYENPLGCNMTMGGDGQRTTWMHDKERREKQAKRFTGDGNPFFGKKHSEDLKRKSSIRTSGYNKKNGIMIPDWGVKKGRDKVVKAIVQYSLNGDFISEYGSIIEVENKLGIDHSSVNFVCNGKRTQAGGFIFRYKTENYPLKIEVGEIKQQSVKKPILAIYKNKTKEFQCAEDASKEYGIPKTTIIRAAAYRNGKPIRTGHIFKYKT
jgi:group I intron endonuclease